MTNQLKKLEALRGFAAVYVLLHHISSSYLGLKTTIWGFPFRFGQEAVIAFFLLSGFVIHYASSRNTKNNFRTYLVKRFRRIYPVFILALVLAYAISSWNAGHLINTHDVWTSLAGNLAMLQDHSGRPGGWFAPFSENMPLWSLSYEWWFYMMYFPIHNRIPPNRQKYLVISLGFLGQGIQIFWPNPLCHFLILFPIWWLGVEIAKEFISKKFITLQGQVHYLLLLFLPLFYHALVNFQWLADGKKISFITYPFVDLRYFASTIGLFGIALIWQRTKFLGYSKIFQPFIRVATFSYALYVLHYPIICNLRFIPGDHWFYPDLILRIAFSFGIAIIAERVIQPWINQKTAFLILR